MSKSGRSTNGHASAAARAVSPQCGRAVQGHGRHACRRPPRGARPQDHPHGSRPARHCGPEPGAGCGRARHARRQARLFACPRSAAAARSDCTALHAALRTDRPRRAHRHHHRLLVGVPVVVHLDARCRRPDPAADAGLPLLSERRDVAEPVAGVPGLVAREPLERRTRDGRQGRAGAPGEGPAGRQPEQPDWHDAVA